MLLVSLVGVILCSAPIAPEPAIALESPLGDWAVHASGWRILMRVEEVDAATGELRGTMGHPTTGKPDRIMGFWDDERQHVSFFRVADSDQADPGYGTTYEGYLVTSTESGDAVRMLVGTATTFTTSAGGSKRQNEVGWFAQPSGEKATVAPEERKAWAYEGGWFETKDGQTWFEMNRDIHNDGLDGFVFQQSQDTPDFIELFDESRGLVVRLYVDNAVWRLATESEWHGLTRGRWLK